MKNYIFIIILFISMKGFSQNDNIGRKQIENESILLRHNYKNNQKKMFNTKLWMSMNIGYGFLKINNPSSNSSDYSVFGNATPNGLFLNRVDNIDASAAGFFQIKIGKNLSKHFSIFSGIGLKFYSYNVTLHYSDFDTAINHGLSEKTTEENFTDQPIFIEIPIGLQYFLNAYKRVSPYLEIGANVAYSITGYYGPSCHR